MAIRSAILVSTTFDVQGRRIREYKGVVRGITVRAPTISQGILGGLKSIIGGQIGAYTEMCDQARQTAYDLMIEHAQQLGANAVIGMSFDASEVAARASATEVLCYGTRSEEHASELQSQSNLVCRLLLEKKKTARDEIILHAC